MEVKLRCFEIGCFECCKETEMPLSCEDIKRIENLGYDMKDFSLEKDGVRVLKNVDGKCYFLKGGRCTIYEFRPLGCRIYPIVYDVERNKATVDEFCPLHREIPASQVKKFEKVLLKLISEVYGRIL